MKNFESVLAEMSCHSMRVPIKPLTIQLENARSILHQWMKYFVEQEGRQMQWLPEYDEVAKWLTNSEGRGLFLYGNCGRGKSILTRYVLPAILLQYLRKVMNVYDIQDMNRDIDAVLSKSMIALDDVGTEEMVNVYGNKRMAFAEIMDKVEKEQKLVIVSTNLSSVDLRDRYGDRVLDRIRATTKRVLFEGKSLRS